MDYVLPESSLTGFMYCGIAVCGIYGVYSDVPEDPLNPGEPVNPEDDSFPTREALSLKVYINGVETCIQKRSLKWSRESGLSGSSPASFTVISTFANRPKNFMLVEICIGSQANCLYGGIITSISDSWFAGAELEADYEYSYDVTTVGFSHYLVRRQVNLTAIDKYASDIIRQILNEFLSGQLSIGHLTSGFRYEYYLAKKQSAANILQELSQDSDAIGYITPQRELHFFQSGDREVPFDLTYSWSWDQGWDIPDNNFSDVTVQEDGEQVVTRLLIHGATYVCHHEKYKYAPQEAGLITAATQEIPIQVGLKLPGSFDHGLQTGDTILIEGTEGNENANGTWTVTRKSATSVTLDGSVGNILDGSYTYGTGRFYVKERVHDTTAYDDGGQTETTTPGYYGISEGQRTFTTEHPIGFVKDIYAEWIYYRTNGTSIKGSKIWRDPMGGHRPGGAWTGAGNVDINEQLPLLASLSDSYLNDYKAQIIYPGAHNEYWQPVQWGRGYLNWELTPEESGKSMLDAIEPEGDPPTGIQSKEDHVFPFDWKIGHGSNTVEFISDIEITDKEEPGKMHFLLVEIHYHEKLNKTFTYQDYTQKAIISGYDSSSDGVIETTFENRDLVTETQRQAYANAFFNLRGQPRFSVSYTHYAEGSGILNQEIYPGMTQVLNIHGQNTTLMVESISYEIVQGVLPILKMNVQLATKQKDLTSLIKHLLQK